MFGTLKRFFLQYWRFLTTAAVVVGVVLPWRVACSDVAPSSCWPVYGWWKIQALFSSLLRIENYAPRFIGRLAITIALMAGVFSFALYMLGNLWQIVFHPAPVSKRWVLFLRATSFASVLVLLPELIFPMMNSGLFWGYYVTAIAVLGSIWLEGNHNVLNTSKPQSSGWTSH